MNKQLLSRCQHVNGHKKIKTTSIFASTTVEKNLADQPINIRKPVSVLEEREIYFNVDFVLLLETNARSNREEARTLNADSTPMAKRAKRR